MFNISNNIFDQFLPVSFFHLPIFLLSATLSILWTFSLPQTHWAKNRQNVLHLFIETIHNNLLQPLSNSQKFWSPHMLASFLLFLSFNLCSLIPYTFAPTSHFSITFSISISTWLYIQTIGFCNDPKSKISHLVPNGTPSYLIPLMIIIETVSLLIQPLTWGFRLGANLLAGHLLILLCSCVVWESIILSPWGLLSFIFLFLLFSLEIAVAVIQASVFLILNKQYLQENIS